MLQVVNTAAPAIPLDRPQTNASRRPDAGGGKPCDPFAALVDESVRSAADRDDLSTAGRSPAKPSRDDGDAPATEPDDAGDAPVDTPAVVAPVWVAPQVPVDAAADLSGVPFEVAAVDAAGTSSSTPVDEGTTGGAPVAGSASAAPDAIDDPKGGEAVPSKPDAAAFSTPASSAKASVAPAHEPVAAKDAPDATPDVDREVAGAPVEPVITPDWSATAAAEPAAEAKASQNPVSNASDRVAVDAAPVKDHVAADAPSASAKDTAAPGETEPAATARDTQAAAPQAHAARRGAHHRKGGDPSHTPVPQPAAYAVPVAETSEPAPAAVAEDVPVQAPRFNARLAGQLQRALKVTGDQAATPHTGSHAASNDAIVTPQAASGRMPFSGGFGRPSTDDTAIGSRTGSGSSAPAPVAPTLTATGFAKFLGTAQAGEARLPSQVLDEAAPQLVQAIRVQVSQGGGEARVHLRPEHLGAVTIDVRVEHGRVSASFNAEVPAVRQWLETHESSLRQGLADQGLHLERFVVNKDGEPPSREGQRREDGRRRQTRRGQADEEQVTFEVIV